MARGMHGLDRQRGQFPVGQKGNELARCDRTIPSTNDFGGYVIVEAESAEAAAALLTDHPHITTFLGDGVDIMPLFVGPDL